MRSFAGSEKLNEVEKFALGERLFKAFGHQGDFGGAVGFNLFSGQENAFAFDGGQRHRTIFGFVFEQAGPRLAIGSLDDVRHKLRRDLARRLNDRLRQLLAVI